MIHNLDTTKLLIIGVNLESQEMLTLKMHMNIEVRYIIYILGRRTDRYNPHLIVLK